MKPKLDNPTTRKPQPAPKVPKARTGYTNPIDFAGEYHFDVSKSLDPSEDRQWIQPVAVLPFRTAKEAKACVKVHNMTAEQRESLMLEECYRQEKAEDEGAELGRIDIIRGYLSALGFTPNKAEGKENA